MDAINQKKLPIQLHTDNCNEMRLFYLNRIDYLQKKDTEYSNSIMATKTVMVLLTIVIIGYYLIYPNHYGNIINDLIVPATLRLILTSTLLLLIWKLENIRKSYDSQIRDYFDDLRHLIDEHREDIKSEYPKSGDFIKSEKPSKQVKLNPISNNKEPTDKTNPTPVVKKNLLINLSDRMR